MLPGLQIEQSIIPDQLPGAAVRGADLFTPASPAENRDSERLFREFGWRVIDQQMAQFCHTLFQMAWVCHNGMRPVRVACMRGTQFVVKDPLHVAQIGPTSYRAFGSSVAAPQVQAMRRKQIDKNRRHYKNDIPDGIHTGETAYVIGNGPSARLAAAYIPKRSQGRKGKVIAINGASKWFSGDMDYWATWDWLGREHWVDGIDFSNTRGLFSQYAAWRCVEPFIKAGGDPNYFVGGNRNEYRKFARGCNLPSLEEGLETMFSVLHWCYRAGFKNVVLFGAEHAIRPHSADIHGGEGDAPVPVVAQKLENGATRLFDDKGNWIYTEVLDYRRKPCWTTPHLHNGAAFIVAIMMFLVECGMQLVNCSNGGLELMFARHIPPETLLEKTEGKNRTQRAGGFLGVAEVA